MRKIPPLLFVASILTGSFLVDTGHIIGDGYIMHNLYVAYFLIGGFLGIIFNYFIKKEVDAEFTQ